MRHQNYSDLDCWLREAKNLHRLSQSFPISHALPVLRRLVKSKVLPQASLLELKHNTALIKRKHLLHMLAIENGAPCWGDFKQQVLASQPGSLLPSSLQLKQAGYPIHWFSNEGEALSFHETNGGKVIRVGEQAAVIPQHWHQ
ncbi:hypothetical protein [Marinomonas epiphytica]